MLPLVRSYVPIILVDRRHISLANGIIRFRNLIYGINVVKVMEGGLTMVSRDINSIGLDKGQPPSVCLEVREGLVLGYFVPSEIKINLLVYSSKKNKCVRCIIRDKT